MENYKLSDWLPTTKKEMELRGWDTLDVILFSGDAYVDHPSFGAAVIGRVLEAEGLRVAIVPQPNWRDDLRDFKKLGIPRLFFGISAGAMDSMVNHYTATKRKRSDDAYTPDKRADMRPDYPTIVYTSILKKLYPTVPVVIGGIEASLRRFSHYDYWQDMLKPSILLDSKADILIYGMGEQPIRELARRLNSGESVKTITDLPQSAVCLQSETTGLPEDIHLYAHEECLRDKKKQALNFRIIEEESNKYQATSRIFQKAGKNIILVNPPYPPMQEKEIDAVYALPFTRMPHPKYKNKTISAYDMIKHSVNTHRGCFGGCAFCTISAHQGKQIISRSGASVLREVKQITQMPDFKGYISDLGGPSANMYQMKGKDISLCKNCKKPSCLFPRVCPNLNADHRPMLEIYRSVDKLPEIKKSFIGSGIRYDMLLHDYKDETLNQAAKTYTKELILNHVSGRLKVAPEHTSENVLNFMRKPAFFLFEEFNRIFRKINNEHNLKQQLIPYFISGHPGCSDTDMAELAIKTKKLDFRLEQVQEFTPTPMTLATEMFYTGINPYTMEKVYSAKGREQKMMQRAFFFWYDPEQKRIITERLKRLCRPDLIRELFNPINNFQKEKRKK
ncbi:MAG: YgiQ family radical SAM protein [Bacteroidales bacterium]|nr:YgiQ family radical SAM protein [Bacteroidales bacterium]